MEIAINTWSFPGDWTLEKQFAVAQEAGFAGFEVDLTENGMIGLKTPMALLEAVPVLASSYGLKLSGLACGLAWSANPASPDPAVRKQAANLLSRQIEAAAAMGIDTVLVIPGWVGVDFIPGSETIAYHDAWDRARSHVESLLPQAERLGVTLAIENVWNKFLLSPREMKEFIDCFDSPLVRSYFDIGNVLATGYPEHWPAVLGSRIARVHFKDYRRAIGTADGFVELLSGDVDWPRVMAALRQVKYEGWCTAEMIPPMPFYKHCPEVLIHNTARALRAILAL